ncbi:MAG: hypothetical protein RSD49_08400 [Hafnia sp.]
MQITRIVVMLTESSDRINLSTHLPQAVWPYKGNQVISFEAARNTGLEYVRRHFDIEPEILDVRTERA